MVEIREKIPDDEGSNPTLTYFYCAKMRRAGEGNGEQGIIDTGGSFILLNWEEQAKGMDN